MGGWDGENPRQLGSAVQTHRRKAFTSIMWVMLLNGLLKKEAFKAGHQHSGGYSASHSESLVYRARVSSRMARLH